ncbi:MAG: saccharopine dehydrogenase NADP-binding domain-containing protein [Planctomycetes bacterium]|nr:saccharopine dehydrogenase NADP-binding domain-containing protein [Planctomycetota bacterium]
MTNALILGAGMVGSVMAADLALDPDFSVTIADINQDNLSRAATRCGGKVATLHADLSNPDVVGNAASKFDIVLGALSSRIGFAALKAVIGAGKNYCDISFMAEDFLELSALARSKGVTAVTDCGVAPGMSNILAAHGARSLDRCERIEIYVGGLPRERRWPYDYKAAFSPADVIEEYTRPARLVEHGQTVVREALSEAVLMDFAGVGTLEAFNTDGLRSLIETVGKRFNVPFMKEQTLRYPGHIELMRRFRETGLFSQTPIRVGGVSVRPLDVTSALLFPKWTYGPGEEDLTVMRITAAGTKGGRATVLSWELLDFFDRASGCTSMSRTTALPCTIVARLIASGKFNSPGVHAPEVLADHPGLVDTILSELGRRGITYRRSQTTT